MNHFIFRPLALAAAVAILCAQSARAASSSWNVDSNGNWSLNTNWAGNVIPGSTTLTNSTDIATFDKTLTGSRVVTVDANRNIGGITFGNTATTNKYTLSGGSLKLTSGGVIQTASTNGDHVDLISSPIAIQGDGGSAFFTAGATSALSGLSFNTGAITGVSTTGNTTTLTINGANTGGGTAAPKNSIASVIGDGAAGGKLAVVKADAGIWQLSAANTFTGGLTIKAGTLVVSDASALGGSGTGAVTLGDSVGSADAALFTPNASTFANPISLGSTSGTLTIVGSANSGTTWSGGVTGTNNLTLNAAGGSNGGLIFSGLVNNSGTITNASTGGGVAIGVTITGGVGSNVSAVVQNSAIASMTISTSVLTVNGTSGTTLTNTAGSSKLLTVSGGVNGTGNLVLNNNSATANGITLSTTAVNNTGTLTNSGTGAGASLISGGVGSNVTAITENSSTSALTISTNAITVNSGGTTLTNSNTAGSKLLTVSGGVNGTGNLVLNNNSAIANGITLDTTTVNNTGTITNTGTGASVTISAVIGSSVQGVVQNSANSGLTLSGANTYTGATTITAGTLTASNAGVAGVSSALGLNSAVSLANAATANLALSLDVQIGSLTGGGASGGNVQLTTKVLTLGGDNTSPAAYAGVISSSNAVGRVVKIGTGAQIFSGANTYTGSTTVSSGTLIAGTNSLSNTDGAFGHTTSAIILGDTTLTGAASILTNGAFTIGRSITEISAPTNNSFSIGGIQTSGTSTYTGNITLTKDTTLTSAAGGQVDFTTGTISGAFNAIIDGGGTVRLASTNTFGGAGKSITLQNGTTLLASTGATGANTNLGSTSNSLTFNNGTLKFGAAFDPSGRTMTFNSGGATFDTNGQTVSFANAVGNSGTGGLTKSGAGTLTLSGANSYTGNTTVTTGTLILAATGSIANSPVIQVASGAGINASAVTGGFQLQSGQKLQNKGTFTGSLTALNGSTYAPGNSPGTATQAGALALNTGSTFEWELVGNTSSGAGTNFDQTIFTSGGLTIQTGVTASLVFNFPGSTVDWTDAFWSSAQQWVVFSGASSLSNVTGFFTTISTGNDINGASLTSVHSNASFSFSNTGNDVLLNYTAVPEPSTWGLLALALTFVSVMRRRRRGGENID